MRQTIHASPDLFSHGRRDSAVAAARIQEPRAPRVLPTAHVRASFGGLLKCGLFAAACGPMRVSAEGPVTMHTYRGELGDTTTLRGMAHDLRHGGAQALFTVYRHADDTSP